MGDGDGIRAGALGDGEGDGRFFARAAPCSKQHILVWFFRAISNFSDLAEVNRFSAINADNHVADIFRALQKRAGLDDDLLVLGGQPAGGELLVRLTQHKNQASGRQIT